MRFLLVEGNADDGGGLVRDTFFTTNVVPYKKKMVNGNALVTHSPSLIGASLLLLLKLQANFRRCYHLATALSSWLFGVLNENFDFLIRQAEGTYNPVSTGTNT